jgi:hypothetical protein
MGKLVLEGNVDAKLKQLETVTNRMIRRVNVAKMSSYLTNFGMHGYIKQSDDQGIIVKDMIPIGGRISYVYLFIEKIVNQPSDKDKRAELIVAIEQKDMVGLSKGIFVKEGAQEAGVSLDVSGGSRLIVKTTKPLEGVWYGLVIDPVPSIKSVDVPGDVVEVTE